MFHHARDIEYEGSGLGQVHRSTGPIEIFCTHQVHMDVSSSSWYRVWREWLGSSAQEHWTRWDIDTCTKHLVNISTGLVLLCTGPKPFPSYSISWAWWNIHVYVTCTKHLNGSSASMHWTQATPFILYITSLMKHPCVLNVYKTSQRVQCSYALDPSLSRVWIIMIENDSFLKKKNW